MKSTEPWRAVVVSVALLAGCGGGSARRDAAIADAVTVDGPQCASLIEQHVEEGFYHISCTSQTDYQTNPPSSGNHFNCWPEYRTYDIPVPWGNLVHALEHGAIVIVYNCPTDGGTDGCPDEVARAKAFIDALPPDTTCTQRRVILAPDPTLQDVRWAASAWTWTLRANCFDGAAFTQFYTDHYDHGREVVCIDGAPFANLCDGVTCY